MPTPNILVQMQQAELKRQEAYKLYLRGQSESIIAEQLHVSQARVSQYLRKIRERNMDWYEQHADPKLRRKSLYKEMADRYMDVWAEQWKLADKKDPSKVDGFRASILSGITRTLDGYRNMIGLVAPTLDMAWMQDQMRKIDEATKKLEEDKLKGPEVAYPKWAVKGLGTSSED